MEESKPKQGQENKRISCGEGEKDTKDLSSDSPSTRESIVNFYLAEDSMDLRASQGIEAFKNMPTTLDDDMFALLDDDDD